MTDSPVVIDIVNSDIPTDSVEPNELEHTDSIPSAESEQINADHLKRIALTRMDLETIKNDLNVMIDAIAHNPSFLSRAATFWGSLPSWQKIVAGIVLVVPALVLGIVAQLAVLITISLVAVGVYVAASLLLDNHNSHNTQSTKEIKASIAALADTLGDVIMSLDSIHQKLDTEITQFQEENKTLIDSNSELGKQIAQHADQMMLWEKTIQSLSTNQVELKETNLKFKGIIQTQDELAQRREIELNKVVFELNDSKETISQITNQLSDQTKEYKKISSDMTAEIEKSKSINIKLRSTLENLSFGLRLTEDKRQLFIDKLDAFIENSDIKLDKHFNELKKEIDNLSSISTTFNNYNKSKGELLDEMGVQLKRVQRILVQENNPPASSQGELLNKLGLHAVKSPINEIVEEAANSASHENTLK